MIRSDNPGYYHLCLDLEELYQSCPAFGIYEKIEELVEDIEAGMKTKQGPGWVPFKLEDGFLIYYLRVTVNGLTRKLPLKLKKDRVEP